jgi:ABC-type sugar transport system substrate-binding protein
MSSIIDTTIARRDLFKLTAPALLAASMPIVARAQTGKRLAYLAPKVDLSFWRYVMKGIDDVAKAQGATVTAYDSQNSAQKQLQNTQDLISRGVDGILLSPVDSSTAPAVLAMAAKSNVPVVIADIGTTEGDYVAFVTSQNEQGAYETGKATAESLKAKGWTNSPFGMVTISLARKNGQLRTNGFRHAMAEVGMKEVALQQMQSYTADETFRFVQDMVTAHPDMRALFVESDIQSIGALRALQAMRRNNDVLLAGFDGVPEFVGLLQQGAIAAAGMQQPYLLGETAAHAMFDHFAGKPTEKDIQIPVLIVTPGNIKEKLPELIQNVFAGETA